MALRASSIFRCYSSPGPAPARTGPAGRSSGRQTEETLEEFFLRAPQLTLGEIEELYCEAPIFPLHLQPSCVRRRGVVENVLEAALLLGSITLCLPPVEVLGSGTGEYTVLTHPPGRRPRPCAAG
jgi:hypothetical protein